MNIHTHRDRQWMTSTDGVQVTIVERDTFSTEIMARVTVPARTFTLMAAQLLLELDTMEKREARA